MEADVTNDERIIITMAWTHVQLHGELHQTPHESTHSRRDHCAVVIAKRYILRSYTLPQRLAFILFVELCWLLIKFEDIADARNYYIENIYI